jgi:glutamate dehydrogenase/leucine dehydrogenase
MGEAFHGGYQNCAQYRVEMRTAAYVTGVKKIVDAMRALGRI